MPTPATPVAYVGFWARTLATLIDLALSSLILEPLIAAIVGHRDELDLSHLDGSPEALAALSQALLDSMTPAGPLDAVVNWGLPALAVLAFWVARQATPGKMVIHARIVDAQTLGKPSTARMIVRYLGYYVSLLALGLGFLWIAWDPRKQGWHDKMAGTLVVRAGRGDAPSANDQGPGERRATTTSGTPPGRGSPPA